MEEHLVKLKFQVEKLNYKFQNVDLLTKALTHSIDNSEINRHFPVKNKTNGRLAVVGEAVLKLVVSEYVILSSHGLEDDQGSWSIRKSKLVQVDKQTEIGKRLFATDCLSQALLKKKPQLLRIALSDWDNRSFVPPYDKFVKALFGAVFLDSGGCSGEGIKNCLQLFVKLWEPHLQEKITLDHKCVKDCFPFPEPPVKDFWKKEGLLEKKFARKFTKTLNLKNFSSEKDYLLLEAIIHKTFYDDIMNGKSASNKRLPHFQRLEFLGDAVLDVILTEYLWNQFPDYDATLLSICSRRRAEDEFQRSVWEMLQLARFVKARNVQNWKDQCDVVEAIIAAVYICRGPQSAAEFTVDNWKLSEGLLELQCKLDHKFQNQKELLHAITHELFHDDLDERQMGKQTLEKNMVLGKAIVKLITTEYAFQACKISAKCGVTEDFQRNLCKNSVLVGISEYLQLRKVARISNIMKNAQTPFNKYEMFVYPILGALYQDLRSTGNVAKFRNIFYRLWNPHLKQLPQRTLQETFARTPADVHDLLRRKLCHHLEPAGYLSGLKGHVEKSMGYTFRDSTLLEQALTTAHCSSLLHCPSLGDCDRLSILGERALEYFSALALCGSMENMPESYKNKLTNCTDSATKYAEMQFNLQLLYWYYTVPEARVEKFDDYIEDQESDFDGGSTRLEISDDCIFKAVFGAIYVDMCSTGKQEEEWTVYLQKLFKRDAMQPQKEKLSYHLTTHKLLYFELQKLLSCCNAPGLKTFKFPEHLLEMKNQASLNVDQLRDKFSCSMASDILTKIPAALVELKKAIKKEKRLAKKLLPSPSSVSSVSSSFQGLQIRTPPLPSARTNGNGNASRLQPVKSALNGKWP